MSILGIQLLDNSDRIINNRFDPETMRNRGDNNCCIWKLMVDEVYNYINDCIEGRMIIICYNINDVLKFDNE
jgi:hypothetical protein